MMAVLTRILPVLLLIFVFAAVTWETVHLVDWCMTMYTRYEDGTLAGYLRMHAYTYMSWVFGEEPFGWTVG